MTSKKWLALTLLGVVLVATCFVGIRHRGRYACQQYAADGVLQWGWNPHRAWPIAVTIQENKVIFLCEYPLFEYGVGATGLWLVDWQGQDYQTPADTQGQLEFNRRYH